MMTEEDIKKHNREYKLTQIKFWLGGVALWIYVLFFQ
jgi:hypothetical protein